MPQDTTPRPQAMSPQPSQHAGSETGSAGGSARRSGRKKRLACQRCQARKIKCDGGQPSCSQCQRARTDCVDGRSTWIGPSISKREALRLQAQNRRLLNVLRERCPDVDFSSLAAEDGLESASGAHVNAAQHDASEPAAPVMSTSPAVGREHRRPHTPGTSDASYGERPGDIAHDLGMIPLSAGVNKYVGPSSGFSIAKMVLAQADRASGYTPGESQADETAEARNRSMFTIKPSPLPTDKHQAVQVSRVYFEQVHPRYPFLHQQTYFRYLDVVYDNSPLATKAAEFQVTMVLAISATILSRRLRIPFTGEGFCAAAMEYADEIDFQSSAEGVQCLLLISMFTLHSPFLGINPWYLNYQCLAAILDLGLQQDLPSGRSTSPFEREMRTRIFWVVFSIDRIIATTLGRPVGLRDEACDLRLPVGYEDLQLDALHMHGQEVSQQPSSSHAPGAVACSIVHFRLSLLNSEIMHTLHSVSHNAPQQTYLKIQNIEAWQSDLYNRLLEIRRDFPIFGDGSKHLKALCEIRFNEIVMLLFRPTPRIRSPTKEALTCCFQSAKATIRLWKDLYHADRMSYSWTSIHSICLSAVVVLYCIWMVPDLARSTEIDFFTQIMVAASNLLSAAGEHWADARRCRDSLNNLTAATVRWLVNLGASQSQSQAQGQVESNTAQSEAAAQAQSSIPVADMMTDDHYDTTRHHHQQQQTGEAFAAAGNSTWNADFPWVDTYIDGEDLASLFRAPNSFSADPALAMEGIFSDYQPLFDFYQGNEFGM